MPVPTCSYHGHGQTAEQNIADGHSRQLNGNAYNRTTSLTLQHAHELRQLHTHNYNIHIYYVLQGPDLHPSRHPQMVIFPCGFGAPGPASDTDSSSEEPPAPASERAGSDGLQPSAAEQPSSNNADATSSHQSHEPLSSTALESHRVGNVGLVHVDTEILRALPGSPFGRFWALFGVCPWRHFAVAVLFVPLFATAAFGYVVLI